MLVIVVWPVEARVGLSRIMKGPEIGLLPERLSESISVLKVPVVFPTLPKTISCCGPPEIKGAVGLPLTLICPSSWELKVSSSLPVGRKHGR